jgi:hypothetical protein
MKHISRGIIFLFFLGFLFLLNTLNSQQAYALASIEYGTNKCDLEGSNPCPAGTQYVEFKGGRTFTHACIASESKFCEVMTGSPKWEAFDKVFNYIYCKEAPLPTMGKCDEPWFAAANSPADFVVSDTVTYNDQIAKHLSASTSVDCNTEYDNVYNNRLLIECGGVAAGCATIDQIKTDAEIAKAKCNNSHLASGVNLSLKCSKANDDSYKLQVPAPFVGFLDGSSKIANYNDDSYRDVRVMTDLGLVIKSNLWEHAIGVRPSEFCDDYTDVMLKDKGSSSPVRCLNTDSQDATFPCAVEFPIDPKNKDNFNQTYCVIGSDVNPDTLTGYLRSVRYAGGDQVTQPMPLELKDLNTTKECNKSAIDYISTQSNKRCLSFVQYDRTSGNYNPKLQKNGVADWSEYDKCIRCVYTNDDPNSDLQHVKPDFSSAQDIDQDTKGLLTLIAGIMSGGDIVKLESDLATTSIKTGSSYRPDIEPFLTPIQGKIYSSDLGCINTANSNSIVSTILRIALFIMGGIVVMRIIQGAITMQQGTPEKFEEGRDIVVSAIIGLLVLILSVALLNFVVINVLQLNRYNSDFTGF